MGSNETQVYNINEDAEHLQAQAELYNHLFAYADTLVLRSAVELRIADIIHTHGPKMTLSQIASKIEPRNIDISQLERVIRMLVRKKILTIEQGRSYEGIEDNIESYNTQSLSSQNDVQVQPRPLYGLTTLSKLLLHDQDQSLAPMFLAWSHHSILKPWFEISRSIKEGGAPFVKAYGESFWEMTCNNREFNKLFNVGMAAFTEPTLDAIIEGYKDGFSKLEGSLLDVGGSVAKLITKIVEAYPHIKGINFDLPHVVENAPKHPGVTHVGGDMFSEIPCADNIILKSVLHDWGDEDCTTILKNCQKAVAQKKGKVIIVDIILHPHRHAMFDDAAIALDMFMMINCGAGKERTESEWNNLLKGAGFTHYNIIQLKSMSLSIIEAFY